MLKRTLMLAIAASCLGGAALAGPGKHAKTAKLTDVMVCPISGKSAEGSTAATEVVGKYRAHFCCGNCQPGFDKLTMKEREKKLAMLAKKQKAEPKKS
jgi:hypothetical protein